MNENSEMIVSTSGDETELIKPDNFGEGLAFLNPDEMPDLEKAEVGISIQPEYVEFVNVGDSIRAIYNGIGHITTKDKQNPGQYKEIEAVVLQTREGVKLNAGANLVSQFRNIRPGTAVQVKYSGKAKTGSGNEVKTYDVNLLNVPRVNMPAPITPTATAKPKYKNTQRSTEYYSMAYSPEFRFNEEDARSHLEACGNDFSAAIDALKGGQEQF